MQFQDPASFQMGLIIQTYSDIMAFIVFILGFTSAMLKTILVAFNVKSSYNEIFLSLFFNKKTTSFKDYY
jgi:hypothetical protein